MNPTLRERLRKTLLGVRPKTVQGQFVFQRRGQRCKYSASPGEG